MRQFVVSQDYEDYTSVDHAVWRYVMRKNVDYLSKVADDSYVEGLRKTGITLDKIPNIQDMNDILGEIGWGAVCVDGFIPPTAFMEFQAYKVLVIAADIRQLEHIEYTPAPDIIHEAAGHAPIIADPEYAEYLRLFGKLVVKPFLQQEITICMRQFVIFPLLKKILTLQKQMLKKQKKLLMRFKLTWVQLQRCH